jgi:hypothetical protein
LGVNETSDQVVAAWEQIGAVIGSRRYQTKSWSNGSVTSAALLTRDRRAGMLEQHLTCRWLGGVDEFVMDEGFGIERSR